MAPHLSRLTGRRRGCMVGLPNEDGGEDTSGASYEQALEYKTDLGGTATELV